MQRTNHWPVIVTLTALLFVALPTAIAHHSFAAIFDSQTIMTVKGTVTELNWGNPHVYLGIAVESNGRTDRWVVELGSMNNLARMGWTRERIKKGDPITITGWRGKPAPNPYLGATNDALGLPRLLRLRDAEFGNGSKFTTAANAGQ